MAYKSDSEWDITTDIYDIVSSIDQVKKRYMEDEDETTLALGIYGFLSDTEAKKIQTATIMTGELGNEMFPTRAKLTKNVLAHAVYTNIENINAVPAHMTLNIGIKASDFEDYCTSTNGTSSAFTIDWESPIFIGSYEFHFDYDIVLQRSISTSITDYAYSAHFDMDENDLNPVSTTTNPYLKQPMTINLGGDKYILFQTLVRQYSIEDTYDKIVSDSVIENKTYTFQFNNQLADFEVYCTDGNVTTRLTPLMYGTSSDDVENYCWYLYISDNAIRISFDSKSYVPGLNTDIQIRAYTTLGSGGVFTYKKVDENEEGLFSNLVSSRFDYGNISIYMVAGTDSTDGSDRKTKEELQKLIPKAALSRGSLTTETDVQNYFNLLDSDTDRLVMMKKVDNQLNRIWYAYFVLKDAIGNIIPTNTIKIKVDLKNSDIAFQCNDGRWIIPAGTIFDYYTDPDTGEAIGEFIDESAVPDPLPVTDQDPEDASEQFFGPDSNGIYHYYYMTIYNLIIDQDPLYTAYYLAVHDIDSFYIFKWINTNCPMQYVANRCNFKRQLLVDRHKYYLTFNIAQSIAVDYGMHQFEEVPLMDDDGNEQGTVTYESLNIRVILVLNNEEGEPYRWIEAKCTYHDDSSYLSSWKVTMETDNSFDDFNKLRITNVYDIGAADHLNPGYFSPTTSANLYILAKFEDGSYGTYDFDTIIPGMEDDGWTVTNVYSIDGGLVFYENFTNILITKITALDDSESLFSISGVPVIGTHYLRSEEQANYVTDALSEKKAYIDYCLGLLENNMDIDFKFFNTYGPSQTYTIGDSKNTLIGHIDLCLKFRVSIKNASDIYTKSDLIAAIKAYIENLYNTDDWHAPVMIAELQQSFASRCNYIEFMNYNDFWLGVNHIEKLEIDDPHMVPEFINVRNRYNDEGVLEPWIDIEIISE